MKSLLIRYKHFIAYVIFGLCTTCVNVYVYYMCNHVLTMPNLPSVGIAWAVAIIFAYIVNKIWVFESRIFSVKIVLREFSTFVSCRLLTGLLDVVVMYIAVDLLKREPVIWKALSDIIVIVLNYLAMRFFVFIKSDNMQEK